MKKLKANQVKLSGWILIPEDKNEADLCFNGVKWALVAQDMDNALRNKIKYGHQFKTPKEALEWARIELDEILTSQNLTLEMII